MAKKSKSFSYLDTQNSLEQIVSTTTKETLVYDLLRIFCGYGDAAIERIVDGRGNDSRDSNTIVIKKVIAYKFPEQGLFGEDDLYGLLDEMQSSLSISRKEPRLYVASDGKRVVAYDPIEKDLYDNDVALLWKDFEFFKPLAGIEKIHNTEEAEADVRSSEMMAKVYDEIRRLNDIKSEEEIHNINIFMTRLLFCFFAEDTGIFPEENMFSNALKQDTKSDASDLGEFIGGIFDIMSINSSSIRSSLPEKITKFPYVNGGLFKEHCPIPKLSVKARRLMLKCGECDWREINPDIFGSMIQAVVLPEERSNMGIHYTSVPNIMKVIQPLFMDSLTSEFIRESNNLKGLERLRIRLSKIKFFDPACGSGNFLVITYKKLRELEILIWKRIEELSNEYIMPFSDISLTQFYGIELSEYACDTAKLSLWLAEHQMNVLFSNEFNIVSSPLPLKPSGNIACGNACRLPWEQVCPIKEDDEVYIFGNPPYKGSSGQSVEQKDDMEYVFKGEANYKKLDYISCWFRLAAKLISKTKSKFAFVTTNSITQGEQVAALWSPIIGMGLEIFFAHTSFMWTNNAKNNAKVAVVIIGVQKESSTPKRLYDSHSYKTVQNINPYLSPGKNIFVVGRSSSISGFPEMIKGCAPVDNGNLILTQEEKDDLIEKYPSSSSLIKKYIGADEFVNGGVRYCLWINEDTKDLAYSIPIIANRIANCRSFRASSKKEATRLIAETPYLFDERKYQPLPSIVVPQTGSERRRYLPMGLADENTVLSNAVRVIYGGDLTLFGIIVSYMHMVWVRAVAGRLKQDMQYSNTICYNTFPFPRISRQKAERIQALSENILVTREGHSEMTLAELYNPETMPPDLLRAHYTLDKEVESCYRDKPFNDDEERLEYLLNLYDRMVQKSDNRIWKTL